MNMRAFLYGIPWISIVFDLEQAPQNLLSYDIEEGTREEKMMKGTEKLRFHPMCLGTDPLLHGQRTQQNSMEALEPGNGCHGLWSGDDDMLGFLTAD